MRLLAAASREAQAFLGTLAARGAGADASVEPAVRAILEEVRRRGDAALLELTARFDGFRGTAAALRVPADTIEAAAAAIEQTVRDALALAAERIEAYHRRQRRDSWLVPEPGIGVLGQLVRPLARVGIYVPGGAATYPSSVLMNAIPARVAGVPEIAMCTPPRPDGQIAAPVLAAARLAGVTEVYRVGGAQAIAALAHGTETIRRVDKIVGPGNIYVATAKRLVFGIVGVDMVAGPSEVLVVSDGTAPAAWVAADLLAQAEHDALASAICLTDSPTHAQAVCGEIARQLHTLPRAETARKSLEAYGAVLLVADLTEGLRLAAGIAPEHLELLVTDPWALLPQVRNAGAVFLGAYTPEAAGDYVAGPSHVLPTAGTARFGSPLCVDDFQQRSSLLALSPGAVRAWRTPIAGLAGAEGLDGHARAAAIRSEEP